MARPLKCYGCNQIESDREKLIKNDKGKNFHIGECYDAHLKHQAFLDQEKEKLDTLYQYIKKLHGIPDDQAQHVLKGVMWRIQELRNGNDIYRGKVEEKKYRRGIEYDLLLDAYKFKEKDIQWFIGQILGGSVTTKDVNACLSIALKGLAEAWRLKQSKKKREEEKKTMQEELLQNKKEREYAYKPKKRDNISDFL